MTDPKPVREFYEKALPKLLPNADFRRISSKGYSMGPNKIDINIPEDEFFKLTNRYEYDLNTFSHFTSLKSLFSILNSGKIRLYNLNNVNDPRELLSFLPNDYDDSLKRRRQNTFIFCGCDYESLSPYVQHNMWRLYGDNGSGVRIEFKVEINQDRIPKNDLLCFKKVNYEGFEIKPFAKEVERIEKDQNIKIDYLDALMTPCILQKESKWALENEVRLVLYNQLWPIWKDEYHDPNTPIFWDWSTLNSCFCNYYEIPLFEPNSFVTISIEHIQLGPFFKDEKYGNLLNELRLTPLLKRLPREYHFGTSIARL